MQTEMSLRFYLSEFEGIFIIYDSFKEPGILGGVFISLDEKTTLARLDQLNASWAKCQDIADRVLASL